MPSHTRNPALALALVAAPTLAKCGPLPPTHGGGTSKSKAIRAEADATARAVIETAFRRTGPTAVAAQIGLSRAAVRGWAEDGGLCLTVRDVLACPRCASPCGSRSATGSPPAHGFAPTPPRRLGLGGGIGTSGEGS